MRRPGGVTYELNNDWANVARALARALRAKLLLGINLELKDRSVATYEARALVSRIGTARSARSSSATSPSCMACSGSIESHGHAVRLRPRSYDLADYTREFNHVSSLLPHVPLAGRRPARLSGRRGSASSWPPCPTWAS